MNFARGLDDETRHRVTRRLRFSWIALWIIAGVLIAPAYAYAQAKTFYLDRLQIGGAPTDGVAVWNPEINGTRVFFQGALGLAYRPFRSEHIVQNAADVKLFQGPPVTHQFIAYATLGVEIKNRLLLSATLPLLISQAGFPTGKVGTQYTDAAYFDPSTVFDMRLEGRLQLFQSDQKTFRLGLRGALFLPTGDEKSYTSDGSIWGQMGLAADVRAKYITTTANVGLTLRPDGHLNAFSVGNEFNYAFGLYVPFAAGRFRLGAELFGSAGLTNATLGSENNKPLEGALNIRYTRTKNKLSGWLGFSAGGRLTAGYAPDMRLIGFAGMAIPPGIDGATKPRPKYDSDSDGLADDIDFCPLVPEDGIHPEDGCPEPKAINKDRDRDGIPNAEDGCPDNPEDKDGIDDEDGCPEVDADGDLVLDIDDKCPKEIGVKGGDPEKEGCPQNVEAKIDIRRNIEFAFDTAILSPKSMPILQEIARTLAKNPQIHKLSIDGHTDDVGTDEYNENLSKARAMAVFEHLVALGVDRNRLGVKWFGRTKPISGEDSEEGHARNRRVELHIEE